MLERDVRDRGNVTGSVGALTHRWGVILIGSQDIGQPRTEELIGPAQNAPTGA
jgi:hypothetical protein